MAKYIGALMITLAASISGMEKSRFAKKELSSLSELYDFFTLLSRRIRERREPLARICAESSDAFAKKLYMCGFVWKNALDMLFLRDDVKEKLLCISESLGGVSAISELELCADATEYLCAKLESAKTELKKKLPLYRSLWLIAGLAAVIILM